MTQQLSGDDVQGILMAAGHGRRWSAAGGHDNKLLHPLPDGTPLVVAAARSLKAVLPCSVAVVRPGAMAVAQALQSCGFHLVWADDNTTGLGENLAKAVASTHRAHGWVVALGDMPDISPRTIHAVAQALRRGERLVAPFYQGQRGHPVGFGHTHGNALMRLQGDVGARPLLKQEADTMHCIEVDDGGILIDMDEPLSPRTAGPA